ncbi:uncharacterized protein LOC113751868 [Coffea eugenioides]|uniref:uncharacterized protein LOC113751860 n=1 Tax=Coffea eugenioides TaxID=49369 RepID=UPI000F5C715D|nr:uncharacterized protein LOC113718129 [Coffea arabica]XP_027151808.1 uncharacterized protein LOC113751860 [Coffea eugenioides]XP_027151815.1 uncharacterized protein LOC113751868 [Coffea eugenioides]
MNDEKGKRPEGNLNRHNIVAGEMCNSNESEYEIELGAKDAQIKHGESYIIDDMEVAEVMTMTFNNEEDAYDFYNAYGKVAGFSVRKADAKKNAGYTTKMKMNDKKGKRPESNLNRHNIVAGEMRNFNESEHEIELGVKDAQIEHRESYIIDDMEVVEVMTMMFQNEEDAYDFYNAYGKVAGFSVTKADVKKNAGYTTKYRKMVCSRVARRDKKTNERDYQKKQPRPETRVGCPACFRIKYDKNKDKYMVIDFVKEYNHKMPSKACVTYLRSHRKVTDADYA